MRRWGQFRICATLLALWVPMVVGDTSPVAHCAQHDLAVSGGDPMAAAGHQHGAQPSEDGALPCTCIGGCTLGRATVVVPAGPVVPQVVVVRQFHPPTPGWVPNARSDSAFVYYATGPPAAVS